MAHGAEDVPARRVLEDTRRAADRDDGQRLQFLRDRGQRGTGPGPAVADDRVDIPLLAQLPILGLPLCLTAVLLDVFDLHAAPDETSEQRRDGDEDVSAGR